MRNIIIIGNGFDRAHNLGTDYESFAQSLVMEYRSNPEEALLTEIMNFSLGQHTVGTNQKHVFFL
tara:strand:- start:82813 stop:83007 length:195 start_codon:yes stop_codon:yes gene_type:complete